MPTVSFTHSSRAPADVAQRLADENIFAWSGHNYAVELAKSLGVPNLINFDMGGTSADFSLVVDGEPHTAQGRQEGGNAYLPSQRHRRDTVRFWAGAVSARVS